MNALKPHLDQLARTLAKLTRAQRLAAGVLVTLLIAAGVSWNQYESASQMQPIVDQSLSDADIDRITTRLEELKIPHRVNGDRILVAAERKLEVLADLGYTDSLPENAQGGFDEILKQMNPWDSSSKTDKMYNRAKEVMLGKVIGKFPGVKNAVVLIDPTSEARIGSTIQPAASVSITTDGNVKQIRQLAGAVVNVMSGAQANLQRERIRVTIDGVPCPTATDDGGALAGDYFERKQQIASALAAKVTEHLAIPSVLVSVTVDVRDVELVPRVDGNWLLAFTRPATRPAPRKTVRAETVTAASINVPRSYFVNIFKASNPAAREPDDAVLQSVVSTGLDRIRRMVKACLGLPDASLITVDCYADVSPTSASPQALAASVGWSDRLNQIALGGIAVVSLLILSLLVKRNHATPAAVSVMALPFEDRKRLPQFLDDDEDEVATYVRTIVESNPDRAASLVSRWLDLKR